LKQKTNSDGLLRFQGSCSDARDSRAHARTPRSQ
jgi:hypothetical protein